MDKSERKFENAERANNLNNLITKINSNINDENEKGIDHKVKRNTVSRVKNLKQEKTYTIKFNDSEIKPKIDLQINETRRAEDDYTIQRIKFVKQNIVDLPKNDNANESPTSNKKNTFSGNNTKIKYQKLKFEDIKTRFYETEKQKLRDMYTKCNLNTDNSIENERTTKHYHDNFKCDEKFYIIQNDNGFRPAYSQNLTNNLRIDDRFDNGRNSLNKTDGNEHYHDECVTSIKNVSYHVHSRNRRVYTNHFKTQYYGESLNDSSTVNINSEKNELLHEKNTNNSDIGNTNEEKYSCNNYDNEISNRSSNNVKSEKKTDRSADNVIKKHSKICQLNKRLKFRPPKQFCDLCHEQITQLSFFRGRQQLCFECADRHYESVTRERYNDKCGTFNEFRNIGGDTVYN